MIPLDLCISTITADQYFQAGFTYGVFGGVALTLGCYLLHIILRSRT